MESDKALVKSLIEGYRQTALVATAVRTGLLDALAENPGSLEGLALQRRWHFPTLQRVMRGLALLGLGVETPNPDGTMGYRLTGAGQLLCTQQAGPWNPYARLTEEQYLGAWMRLDSALLSGKIPFDEAFGRSVWDHRRAHAGARSVFDQWLHRLSSDQFESFAQAYDFSDVSTVLDLGGGRGALLSAVLRAHPSLRGILADQAEVVESARESLAQNGCLDRCEIRAVDFFKSVPAGFDLYLLKSVLHDWDDAASLVILQNVRDALAGEARLLIIERLLPERALEDPETVWLDLHMLCVTGGRERSLGEYHALLAGAGLRFLRVVKGPGPFQLLEACRA
jgi:SAM-dependent methyltransferase